MIKHLIKLVWNRKRTVGLTVVEVALCFLTLFALAGICLSVADLYQQPLGFSYDNVWSIEIARGSSGLWSENEMVQANRLLREVSAIDGVTAATLSAAAPYTDSFMTTRFLVDNIEVQPGLWEVGDGFLEVMNLELTEGRWFSRDDDGLNYRPLIITEELRQHRFGSQKACGKTIHVSPDGKKEARVVGVVTAFRHLGELTKSGLFTPENHLAFERSVSKRPFMPMTTLLIKVAPGAGVELEQTLVNTMEDVAKDWSFEVQSLVQMRDSYFKEKLQPILLGGVVAAFLLLMVGLGLVGVLWQNVTQRTRELGLRRAHGATRIRIYRQIVGETLVICTIAVVFGLVVISHIGFFDVLITRSRVYWASTGIAMVVIYLATALCALYPSWLATTVHPAEALHYE